ncbi:putative flavoprotein involved in K+ transport [Nitrosospira sp. Nsp5]|uniref:Flavoprotein involved in K+ transport n=2 Tax=Nitrosospira multiformis TaxID=1231 RepID=A0ABY0TIE0_9PROT|nr:NAD(P)/FAD-dependent oxidoreductase [Nitrosospira sp. Nsp5]PTR06804.1 putative flavoprotein involved in K+ transport [Nitrosospira sp. Nsp5]SDQ88642.1 putative flavoprotein involved in K+ transport [Nitrosospira multiformis]
MTDVHDVAVIGAGPAGLSVAYELKRTGLDPLVLEKTPAVGDVWRNHYDGLRLNSGRVLSQLPGSPFPRSAGRWPSRDELVRILETFPERGGFTVQTGIDIGKIEYDPQRDIWVIASHDGAKFESRSVVIATGGARIPVIPEWEGMETFSGEIIHSSKFKNARTYAGQHVLVVGSGNSAAEIASRLVEHARTVTISIRTPPHILPKSVFGVPLVGIGVATHSLPVIWVDGLLQLLQRVFIGDLTPFGLPFPSSRVSQQFARTQVVPILYHPFVGDVRAGRIRIVGPIRKISGQSIHAFHSVEAQARDQAKEAVLSVDAIVAGTGFRTGIAELVQVPGIATPDDRPVILGDQEFSGAPRLYFIGQLNPLSGQLREIRLEATRIANKIGKQLAGRVRSRADESRTGSIRADQV